MATRWSVELHDPSGDVWSLTHWERLNLRFTVNKAATLKLATIGGTAVSIIGNGFVPGSAVTFGGDPASDVVVVTSRIIQATTPPGAAGPSDVVLPVARV